MASVTIQPRCVRTLVNRVICSSFQNGFCFPGNVETGFLSSCPYLSAACTGSNSPDCPSGVNFSPYGRWDLDLSNSPGIQNRSKITAFHLQVLVAFFHYSLLSAFFKWSCCLEFSFRLVTSKVMEEQLLFSVVAILPSSKDFLARPQALFWFVIL